MQFDLDHLNFAYGRPPFHGRFKVEPQDFVVTELMALTFSHEGEHVWCWIKKTGQNTDWVAKALAKHFEVPIKSIGYAGKKDRQAVTYQWMSVHLPGKALPDSTQVNLHGVEILKTVRHSKKLQKGQLEGNRFELVLTALEVDKTQFEERFESIKKGVPNYFGAQRFGREYGNLAAADKLFLNPRKRVPRHLKGLYLSAARSWMFNEVLSRWLAESSVRKAFQTDVEATGMLTGRGELVSEGAINLIEAQVMAAFSDWQIGLEKAGLKQERRNLLLVPSDPKLTWLDNQRVKIEFALPAGSFATAFLRELLILD